MRLTYSFVRILSAPLTVLSVRFVMFCDVPVPSCRGLLGYLEFNESSRLPPVFVSAALETTVLLPKFLRACPNALSQRKHFQLKPHCFDGRFQLVLLDGTGPVQGLGMGCAFYDRTLSGPTLLDLIGPTMSVQHLG
jgi:hypothetical protein